MNKVEKISKKSLYRNLIILYCPEKVGSTSIASSIRIFASDEFIVFHTHDDKIADIVNQGQIIRVKDLIMNNKILNPYTNEFRKIYLIDIFRTPIERKISAFFQKISEIHFNNSEINICNYPIEKIIKRFNDLFVNIKEIDYFNEFYNCQKIDKFDFENKYIIQEHDNVFYVKLRLNDSNLWGDILSKILNTKIIILKDYETINKNIGQLYKKFINEYKLPYNYYKLIENDLQLNTYLNEDEKKIYLIDWFKKISHPHIAFTNLEYEFYLKISNENKFYCANSSNLHYCDDGCVCDECVNKRNILKYNIENNCHNQENYDIKHTFDDKYDNNIYIKLYPTDNYEEECEIIINLINS